MNWTDLSPAAQVGIVVIAALQLSLQVAALTVLVRTPPERLSIPKWVWAAVILVGSVFGSVVFLAVGRGPAPVAASPRHAVTGRRPDATARAIDLLYGARR